MSQAIATTDSIAAAIKKIVENGRNPTVQEIRTELGGGSPNTILKHRKMDLPPALAGDLSDLQVSFEMLYRRLFERGRADCLPEIDSLSQQLKTALIERDAARMKEQELRLKYDDTLTQLNAMRTKLAAALEDAGTMSKTIVTLQERHARELKQLHRQLEKALGAKNTP